MSGRFPMFVFPQNRNFPTGTSGRFIGGRKASCDRLALPSLINSYCGRNFYGFLFARTMFFRCRGFVDMGTAVTAHATLLGFLHNRRPTDTESTLGLRGRRRGGRVGGGWVGEMVCWLNRDSNHKLWIPSPVPSTPLRYL